MDEVFFIEKIKGGDKFDYQFITRQYNKKVATYGNFSENSPGVTIQNPTHQKIMR